MINNAEKVESNVKTNLNNNQVKKTKGGLFSKWKLACCGFIFLILIVLLASCSFLWMGGHIQKYSCTVVEKDSQIWDRLSCGTEEVKQEGEGEFKYNVLDGDNITVSDIEVVVSEVVEKASPAVVAIALKEDDYSAQQVIGSGFIVTENGLIVTNQHVVSDRTQEYIVLINGQEKPVKIEKIFRDEVNDIAILQVDLDGLKTLPLGDSDNLKVGQTTIAIGNPLGSFEGTVTTGIISGLNRDVEVGSGFFNTELSTFEGVIQTDAAINPGNSGGPLLNSNGEVIGVNFATIQGADGLSFALPINRIKNRIEELNKFGDFKIPFLGVEYRQRVVFFEGESITGAVTGNVVEKSPAAKAGIKEGDIIIKFDGKDLEGTNLATLIQTSEIGKEVEVLILRNDKQVTLKVTIGDRADASNE